MSKELYREILKELKNEFPTVSKIEVDYEGSGDSFDDFYNTKVEYTDNKELDDEKIKDFVFSKLDDPIWECIKNSGADFNNEGCRGTVTIDLDNLEIKCDCYGYYTETKFEGEYSYFD